MQKIFHLQGNETPLLKIEDEILSKYNISLYVHRIDLIHPYISGNKWFKLKYNLIEARNLQHNTLISFGGAYSNHIYALAAAGKEFGFKTIGIIRGEEHLPLNPTLTFAKKMGMKLHYIPRSMYRKKYEQWFLDYLKEMFDYHYLIPEGGSNELAVRGCEEILADITVPYDYVVTANGTGGTIAGIISFLENYKHVIGIPVLKGAGFLEDDIRQLLYKSRKKGYINWELKTEYHFGGYAKIMKPLVSFIDEFKNRTGIQLDPVYTGKMMFGIYDLIQREFFPKNCTIIAIHSGGLQGIEGMMPKINKIRN